MKILVEDGNSAGCIQINKAQYRRLLSWESRRKWGGTWAQPGFFRGEHFFPKNFLKIFKKFIQKFSKNFQKNYEKIPKNFQKNFLRYLLKMPYFSIFSKEINKPSVQILRVQTKNAMCWKFLRKFSKVFKHFLKKIAKIPYFTIFLKRFNKPSVQFLRVQTKNAICRKF